MLPFCAVAAWDELTRRRECGLQMIDCHGRLAEMLWIYNSRRGYKTLTVLDGITKLPIFVHKLRGKHGRPSSTDGDGVSRAVSRAILAFNLGSSNGF